MEIPAWRHGAANPSFPLGRLSSVILLLKPRSLSASRGLKRITRGALPSWSHRELFFFQLLLQLSNYHLIFLAGTSNFIPYIIMRNILLSVVRMEMSLETEEWKLVSASSWNTCSLYLLSLRRLWEFQLTQLNREKDLFQ